MRRLIAWVSRVADPHTPTAGDAVQPSKPSSAPTSDPEPIGTDGVAGQNPDDLERASEAILRTQSGAQPNEEIVQALVPDDQPRFLTFVQRRRRKLRFVPQPPYPVSRGVMAPRRPSLAAQAPSSIPEASIATPLGSR